MTEVHVHGPYATLAVRLAADRNLTLCGFARDGVNVYTGSERVR
jgi:formate dehydrogenase assembly factor FdhD